MPSFAVTAVQGCTWTAAADAPWISVASGASGNGAGATQVVVAANVGPDRSGSVLIAGQRVSIVQATGCVYNITPTSADFTAQGGSGSIGVTTTSGCPWTAATTESWLTISAGASATGPGTVSYAVASSIFEARSGIISVAGKTFTASQARGCVVSISATSASFSADGGSGGFQVMTSCPWNTVLVGGAGWVTLTRGGHGNGDGPVTFTVQPNDGPARSATLVVEDHFVFTINQAGR
jgi:hypothetical protein